MTKQINNLVSLKALLPLIDWQNDHYLSDPLAKADDRTSINYVADCYITLPPEDVPAARRLIHKHIPKGWDGWPVIVNAARKRQRAFEQAIEIGTLSANPQDENHTGNYFYSHRESGNDYFRHRKTFKLLESPSSKGEIEKYAAKHKYGFELSARSYSGKRSGFTLTEIAIVLGIIGLILAAIWTAAAAVYGNYRVSKASTETLAIVQNFKMLYGNGSAQEPNGTDITSLAIAAGMFPADMIQPGNTAYGIGPWAGSQVNVYSGATWNAITVAFWNIDQSTCNRLADAIAIGSAFTGAGLVWVGVNNTTRTYPPFGTDQPFTVSDIAAACSGGSNINVQVTYGVN